MSDIHLPHTIFDPSSRYNRMRTACDPREKLVGFFDWLDYAKKRGIAAPVQFQMAAATGPLVIRLDDVHKIVEANVEVPVGDKLTARYEVRFQLPEEDRPARETLCRVLLLEPETFKRLRENLAAEGRPLPRDEEEAIRLLLSDNFLENSAEAARVFSALPELEGSVGPDGRGSASAEVPFGSPNAPLGTQIVVVYEPPPAPEIK